MAPVKVKININGLADGTPVGVTYLNAELLNNVEVEVTDEAVTLYEARSGKKFADLLKSKKFGGPGKPKPKAIADSNDTTEVEKAVKV